MPPSPTICAACAVRGPAAVLATDARGRQAALCRACADDPARLRLLVGHLDTPPVPGEISDVSALAQPAHVRRG